MSDTNTPDDLGEPKGEATGAIGPVGNQGDIAEYLEELEDIPGTRVYTAARARKGYWLNQFAMSLMKEENRTRWRADEKAYLDEWQLSDAVKQALLDRDYNRMLDLGGNIYFLAKVFSTDGLSFLQAVSTMTGMSVTEYKAMMDAGGRSPEGVRSKKANLAAASGKAKEDY